MAVAVFVSLPGVSTRLLSTLALDGIDVGIESMLRLDALRIRLPIPRMDLREDRPEGVVASIRDFSELSRLASDEAVLCRSCDVRVMRGLDTLSSPATSDDLLRKKDGVRRLRGLMAGTSFVKTSAGASVAVVGVGATAPPVRPVCAPSRSIEGGWAAWVRVWVR